MLSAQREDICEQVGVARSGQWTLGGGECDLPVQWRIKEGTDEGRAISLKNKGQALLCILDKQDFFLDL